ncbi:hypothetical protein DID88_000287 [Monilinia fructigena]|uniref:DUF5672 domain-containing protein n=1 Tax=Monilinia fructigena TaxID=38457 RepID=A0A395IIE9_9HELO|nr:hypothetical protein DID88_000287 [Monilinia fructigena]
MATTSTGLASWSFGSRMRPMAIVGVFLSLVFVYGFAYQLKHYEAPSSKPNTSAVEPHTIVQIKTVEYTVTHTNPELYKFLSPAEHLLVFQPDSILCTKAPTTLNDFLQYDYVGAPWSAQSTYGGNGGLSLRRVSSILKVLEKERRKPGDGQLEDLWLSNTLNKLQGTKMANAKVSKSFSVESIWDEAPLGYHIGWLGVHHGQIWDKPEYVSHIMNYCPEVKIILGMKLDNDKPEGIS